MYLAGDNVIAHAAEAQKLRGDVSRFLYFSNADLLIETEELKTSFVVVAQRPVY